MLLPNSAERLASKSSFGECELYRSTAKHKLLSQDEAILAMEVPGQRPRAPEADKKSRDGKAIVLPSASQMSMPREEEEPCHDFHILPLCPKASKKEQRSKTQIHETEETTYKDYSHQGSIDVVNCLVPPDRASSKNSCAVTATAAATLRRNDSGTSSAAGDRFSERIATVWPLLLTSHRPVSVKRNRDPSSPFKPVPFVSFVKPEIRAKTPGQKAPGFAILFLLSQTIRSFRYFDCAKPWSLRLTRHGEFSVAFIDTDTQPFRAMGIAMR